MAFHDSLALQIHPIDMAGPAGMLAVIDGETVWNCVIGSGFHPHLPGFGYQLLAKGLGATMWFFIFYRAR